MLSLPNMATQQPHKKVIIKNSLALPRVQLQADLAGEQGYDDRVGGTSFLEVVEYFLQR